MKIRIYITFVLNLLLTTSSFGQSTSDLSNAETYITTQQGVFSSFVIKGTDFHISSSHISSISGVRHIYYSQSINDIDIFNAVSSVHLDRDGNIAHATNNFLDLASFQQKSALSTPALNAVHVAADHFNLPRVGQTSLISEELGASQKKTFTNPSYSRSDITSKLLYIPRNNDLVLTWEVVLDIAELHEKWAIYVEAGSSKVIDQKALFLDCDFGTPECAPHIHQGAHKRTKNDLTYTPLELMTDSSYNVFAIPLEAPNEGVRSIVVSPWSKAPTASPFGWHDVDGIPGADSTNTKGNNVTAIDDLDGNSFGGNSPDGTSSLIFDFPLDVDMSPLTYTNGAITNLFYMNNIVHDVSSIYGFDEASGNFQVTNYGLFGVGGDAVRAEAQDGSDTNNARFFSAPEGFSPRMEMYQWIPSIGSAILEVTAPGNVAGIYNAAKPSAFGPSIASISGDIVLADPIDGCAAYTNPGAVNGKIALVDRGDCNFTVKVKGGQDAGAIAVIVCNNIPGDGVIAMGGSDPSITIPSAMISYEDCQLLRVEVGNGLAADLDLVNLVNTDSDLDNGIIAHEYGHGISIRLTGGPENIGCLSGDEQMGEGWSDYFGLMLQLKPGDEGPDRSGIGTYVTGDVPTGNGIRPFPYSTDFNENPMTYNTIANVSIPHGVGSVWCTMLWDMTWNLIEKHGYEPDVYATTGGNGIAMQLVMEGLKLQKCAPGFVSGRDAILKADTLLFGATNACEIWRAFARRGLGVGASQGSEQSVNDGVESYLRPDDCPEELIKPCTDDVLVYNNETIADGTDERITTTITITESDVLAGSDVMLRAQDGISVHPQFELSATGELLLKVIPCIDIPNVNGSSELNYQYRDSSGEQRN